MPPARLVMVLHCHQPVGNLDSVFEDATRRCYAPLIETLGKTPSARVALHLSGPVIEWLDLHRPDLLAIVRLLASRGQIEILGGAQYEPVLAVLPEADALAQIRTMTNVCEHHFGVRPTGMWLAERVWEPDLARLLALAGMQYTLLDDAHFRAAGESPPRFGDADASPTGYWVTEKAGAPVAIFPIHADLRRAMPFREVDVVVQEIAKYAGRTVTVGDDAEKLGLWPGTHERVWQGGWLASLLGAIEEASDIELVLPSEELATRPASGRVYLPATTYDELREWSGGLWQSFLVRYDEANRMHKKMLRVSRKVAAMTSADSRAVTALHRGQCNDAYWHGLFGGLYSPHLRRAVYANLLEAEARAEPALRPRAEVNDHDGDFSPEVLLETATMNVYVKPACGGAVFEIDDRRHRACLTDVLSEYREADDRHGSTVPLRRGPPRVRRAFVDHLLPAGAGPAALDGVALADLAHASYEIVEASEDPTAAWALLRGETDGVRVRKTLRVAGDAAQLEVAYEVRRLAGPGGPCLFVVETAFALPSSPGPDRFWELPGRDLPADERVLCSRGVFPDVQEVHAVDRRGGLRIAVQLTASAEAWHFPLESVSRSESGVERIEQGTVLALAWPAELVADGPPLRVSILWRIDPL